MTNFEFQVQAVKELKMLYQKLEKKCKHNLNKIEQEGITSNYSVNPDVVDIALSIHKISSVLGYIKTFNLEFLDKEKK